MSTWGEQAKSFLHRIAEYLRRGSEVAGQWIDEQAAINQRIRAIRRLRAEQQKLLTLIGSKVYTLHTRGKVRNRDVLADCQRIDELLAHIARLKEEIEEIKKRSTRPEVQLIEVEDQEPLAEAEEEAETQEAAAEEEPAAESSGEQPGQEGAEETAEEGADAGSAEQAPPEGQALKEQRPCGPAEAPQAGGEPSEPSAEETQG